MSVVNQRTFWNAVGWSFGIALLLLLPLMSHSAYWGDFEQGSRRVMVSDGSLVGNFAGKFSVNASGSAEYTIPVQVPAGTGGMTPSLSIHYDSSGGNGILGMGFSLAGLTAITRVPQNLAQNGKIHGVDFTEADRFALNGQQLVALSGQAYGADGTEYRTYIDSQTRILSTGRQGAGPAGFVVQTKGGQTAWYGTTADSQILAAGKTTVAVWALAKIQDAAGNFITYHYTQEAGVGSYYLREIDYTGNEAAHLVPYNKIVLSYEDRPDVLTSYTAGSVLEIAKRLSAIHTYTGTPDQAGSQEVMSYHLNYETSPNTFRSRITSIQACDAQGACLRPLQFLWQTNAMGWEEQPASEWAVHSPIVMHRTDGGQDQTYDAGVRFMDVHGDGKPEVLFARDDWDPHLVGALQGGAQRATEQGWVDEAGFRPPIAITEFSNGWSPGMYVPRGMDFVDIWGDGHVHLIQSLAVLETFYPKVLLPGHHPTVSSRTMQNHYVAQAGQWQGVDGGNLPGGIVLGATNFFVHAHFGGTTSTAVNYLPQSPGQWVDLQQTGRLSYVYGGGLSWLGAARTVVSDPTHGWHDQPAYVSPRPFVTGDEHGQRPVGSLLLDVDGDGLPDFVVANPQEHGVWRNTGNGWMQEGGWTLPGDFLLMQGDHDGGGRVVNLTTSGLPDLLMGMDGGTHQAWVNTGAGWIEAPVGLKPPTDMTRMEGNAVQDLGVVLADVTGSGLPAYLQCSGAASGGRCQAWLNENGRWVEHPEYAPPAWITDAKGHDNGVRLVDLLGTGFPDFVVANEGEQKTYRNKAQLKPDLVTTIQEGLGDPLQIHYQPITDSRVYTKGVGAQYPNRDIQAPIWVVSQTRSDTAVTPLTLPAKQIVMNGASKKALALGDHPQQITDYAYANAEFNQLGWGFLGFGTMTATDERTGIRTTTTTSLDTENHTQGLPMGTVTTLSDGTVIQEQQSSLAVQMFGNGQPNATYYFPYAQSTISKAYDLKGRWLSTKTTENVLDAYGNPIDVKETAQDTTGTYLTETQNQVVNMVSPASLNRLTTIQVQLKNTVEADAAAQRLARPSAVSTLRSKLVEGATEQSSVSSPAVGGSAALGAAGRSSVALQTGLWRLGEIHHSDVTASSLKVGQGTPSFVTRHSDFTYDDQGFLKTATDSAGLMKSFRRDIFGHIVQTTLEDHSGAATPVASRSESVTYDSVGRFITGQTNALGHTSTQVTDARFGVVTQTTDANGVTTRRLLDSLGRVLQTTHADGTSTQVSYQWTGGGADPAAPANAVYKITQTQAQVPTKVTYYDELDRPIAETTQGFIGDEGLPQDAQRGQWIWQLTYYDDLGRILGKTLPFFAGGPVYLSTHQYDVLGRLVLSTNPDGSQTRLAYDGYRTTLINAKGQSTSRLTNVRGNLLEAIDAQGHRTAYTYDPFNNLTQLVDSQGHVSTMAYDALGHKVAMDDPDRGHSSYTYDAFGELTRQTDANQNTTAFQYDALGRTVARTDTTGGGQSTTSRWLYDTAPHGIGKLAEVTGVSGAPENRVRGQAGSSLSAPTAIELFRAAQDHIANYQKCYEYDTLSRPIRTTTKIQEQSYTATQTYDAWGRPDTATAPNGLAVTSHYDALGYLTRLTDGTTGETYQHIQQQDAAGHITRETQANGMITTTTYDPKTQLVSAIQTTESQSLQRERQFLPGYAKRQESVWRLHTSPSSSQVSGHNSPHASSALALITTTSPAHLGSSIARAATTNSTNASPLLRLAGMPTAPFLGKLKLTDGQSAVQSLQYTYDALGNPTQKSDRVLSLEDDYAYDTLNRLAQDTTQDKAHQTTATQNYAYDALGNLTDKSDVGHYTYGESDAGPHAVTQIQGQEVDQFHYDATGNQIQATRQTPSGLITRNVSYTSFDVPKQITQTNSSTQASATVSFAYDADRQRFLRTDESSTVDPATHQTINTKTTTLYLGSMTIETTTDPTGTVHTTTKNYVGNAEKVNTDGQPGHTYTLLQDNLGSTSVIADETGNVVQRFHYDPWGEQNLVVEAAHSANSAPVRKGLPLPRDSMGWATIRDGAAQTHITPYGFTGQEGVQTGGIDLMHLNGRMYDQHLGRFLSADPLIQDPSNSQSLNRYSYCLNNPLTFTDPSGFSIARATHNLFPMLREDIGYLRLCNDDSLGFLGTLCNIVVGAIAIATLPVNPGAAVIFEHFALAAAFSGALSYAETGSVGGAFQTAALTLVGEYAWFGTGSLLGGQVGEAANPFTTTLAHGMVGGSLTTIQGEGFKNGFLAAAVSQALAAPVSSIHGTGAQWGDIMARGVASGVVGGTVAAATGGNFENGMMTSAFAELFNDSLHSYRGHYQNADALKTAMGPNAIVWGERPLDNPVMQYLHTDLGGVLSGVKFGGYHEEIFWTDEDNQLYAIGDFKADANGPGGIRRETARGQEIGSVNRYSFQPIQQNFYGSSTTSSYFKTVSAYIYNASNYHTFGANCQNFGENSRNALGFNHYG